MDNCPACPHIKHTGKPCPGYDFVSDPAGAPCPCTAALSMKANAGKPAGFSLLPWDAITELAEVYAYGERKYEADSWRKVPNAIKHYTDALFRHWRKYSKGETLDPESNLRHLAHVCWNIIALMELTRDDPPK